MFKLVKKDKTCYSPKKQILNHTTKNHSFLSQKYYHLANVVVNDYSILLNSLPRIVWEPRLVHAESGVPLHKVNGGNQMISDIVKFHSLAESHDTVERQKHYRTENELRNQLRVEKNLKPINFPDKEFKPDPLRLLKVRPMVNQHTTQVYSNFQLISDLFCDAINTSDKILCFPAYRSPIPINAQRVVDVKWLEIVNKTYDYRCNNNRIQIQLTVGRCFTNPHEGLLLKGRLQHPTPPVGKYSPFKNHGKYYIRATEIQYYIQDYACYILTRTLVDLQRVMLMRGMDKLQVFDVLFSSVVYNPFIQEFLNTYSYNHVTFCCHIDADWPSCWIEALRDNQWRDYQVELSRMPLKLGTFYAQYDRPSNHCGNVKRFHTMVTGFASMSSDDKHVFPDKQFLNANFVAAFRSTADITTPYESRWDNGDRRMFAYLFAMLFNPDRVALSNEYGHDDAYYTQAHVDRMAMKYGAAHPTKMPVYTFIVCSICNSRTAELNSNPLDWCCFQYRTDELSSGLHVVGPNVRKEIIIQNKRIRQNRHRWYCMRAEVRKRLSAIWFWMCRTFRYEFSSQDIWTYVLDSSNWNDTFWCQWELLPNIPTVGEGSKPGTSGGIMNFFSKSKDTVEKVNTLAEEIAPIVGEIPNSVENLNNTLSSITAVTDEFKSRNLLGKADDILSAFVTKVQKIPPSLLESDCDVVTRMANLVNDMVKGVLSSLLGKVSPWHDLDINMNYSAAFVSLIIARSVQNRALKYVAYANVLRTLKLYDVVAKFFQGFTCENPHEMFTDSDEYASEQRETFGGNAIDWLIDIFARPMEILKNFKDFVAGFVWVIVGKFSWKSFSKFMTNISGPFKAMSNISVGFNSIPTIINAVKTAYYTALDFAGRCCGIKIKTPVFYKFYQKLQHWGSFVDVITMPMYRNAMISSPDSVDLVNNIISHGRELVVRSIEKKVNISPLVNEQMKKLNMLRAALHQRYGMPTSTHQPFVLHLIGPPGIGKSTFVHKIVRTFSDAFRLAPDPYHFNELQQWFDDYQGQEILVCDDVNLSKDPDHALWLIKLVNTSITLLPTADNNNRPMYSNVKIIILTSNIEYSNASNITTHQGLDRRSQYKFRVTSSDYDDSTKSMKSMGVDWSTTHQFERIPSVSNAKLAAGDNFKGDTDKFRKHVLTKAQAHFISESRRLAIEQNHQPELIPGNPEWVNKLLKLSEGPSLPIDIQLLKESFKKLTFPIFTTGWNELGNMDVEANLEKAEKIRNCTALDDRVNLVGLYLGFDKAKMEQLKGFMAQYEPKWWPVYTNHRTTFSGTPPVNWLDDPDLMEDPNNIMIRFDGIRWGITLPRQFLHVLEIVVPRDGSSDVKWIVPWDYPTYDPNTPYRNFRHTDHMSLLKNKTILMGAKTFFELPPLIRILVYYDWQGRKNASTATQIQARWQERLLAWMKSLTAKDVVENLLLGSLLSMSVLFTLASAVLLYKIIVEVPTSQPPQVKNQVQGVKPIHNFTAGSQTLSLVKPKIMKNQYLCAFVSKTGSYSNFVGTFVTSTYLMIPWHAYRDGDYRVHRSDPDWIEIQVYSQFHRMWIPHYFNQAHIHRIPRKDVLIINLSSHRPMANILGHFAEGTLSAGYTGVDVQLLAVTETSPIILAGHYRGWADKKTLKGEVFYGDYVHTCPVERGHSGGLLVVDSDSIERKIIGIQSTKTYIDASASAITRSELNEAIDKINAKMNANFKLPEADVEVFETSKSVDNPYVIGETKQSVVVPLKTKLKKTPWYDQVLKASDKIPCYRYKTRDQIYNYIGKTEKTSPKAFDPVLLQECVDEYSEMLIEQIGDNLPSGDKTLTIDQVLTGNYLGGKSIDTSTSPGIGLKDWIHQRVNSGQTDWIRLNDDGTYFIHPELTEAIRIVLGQCMAGSLRTSTYASFPKDELRMPDKDVRGIDGAPMEQKIVYKMLFGRIDALLAHLNCGQLSYGPGINLSSPSGTRLFDRITDKACMWDFSKFDGSITHQLWMAAVAVYNNICQDSFGPARLALAHSSCCANIVADKYVLQPNTGMRSGFGGTASFNSHIHSLLIIYVIKLLFRKQQQAIVHLTEIKEYVDWIVYSDDAVMWHKNDTYDDLLNGETLAQELQELGFIVADPENKNELPKKFIPKSKVVFLQHTPYYDQYLKVGFWRLSLESIGNALNYYRGSDPFEAVDSVFFQLFAYGPKFYDNIRRLFNERSRAFGRKETTTWLKHLQEFQRIYMQEYDHQYTPYGEVGPDDYLSLHDNIDCVTINTTFGEYDAIDMAIVQSAG